MAINSQYNTIHKEPQIASAKWRTPPSPPNAERRAYATTIRAPANTFFLAWLLPSIHPSLPCLSGLVSPLAATTSFTRPAKSRTNPTKPVPCFYMSQHPRTPRKRTGDSPSFCRSRIPGIHESLCNTQALRVGSAGAGAAIPASHAVALVLSPTRQGGEFEESQSRLEV